MEKRLRETKKGHKEAWTARNGERGIKIDCVKDMVREEMRHKTNNTKQEQTQQQ